MEQIMYAEEVRALACKRALAAKYCRGCTKPAKDCTAACFARPRNAWVCMDRRAIARTAGSGEAAKIFVRA